MASEVQIYNMALSRVGIGQRVESTSERTTPAKTCAFWFPLCRDEVLRDGNWPFAQRAVALAAAAGQTFPGWQYVYGYPSGALKIQHVTDEQGVRLARSSIFAPDYVYTQVHPALFTGQPYEVALGSDGTTKVILTDQPDAYAIYTAQVTDPTVLPMDFVSALAWKLASEIALPLQAPPGAADRALNAYSAFVSRAKANGLNESQSDPERDPPSINARL